MLMMDDGNYFHHLEKLLYNIPVALVKVSKLQNIVDAALVKLAKLPLCMVSLVISNILKYQTAG